MKKALIALLGVIVLAGASAFATETRTTVMGENNMIMVDDANIGLFPGRVNNYPNLVLGEFGDDEMYNFGITWQFNDENPWVLGTFVSTYPSYGPYGFWGDDLARFPNYDLEDDYEAVTPQNAEELNYYSHPKRMSILYGRKLGGHNFGFGLDVVRASWEAEEDSGDVIDTDVNPKQSFSQYKFSFGLTEGTSGKWDVGVSALFGGWNNEDPWGQKISEPSGFMDLTFASRYFMTFNPKVTLVPHVSVAMNKRGAKYRDILRRYDSTTFEYWDGDSYEDSTFGLFADDNAKTEYSTLSFDLGVGMNYTPAPNMLAVLDFGFSFNKIKAEYSRGADIDRMIAFRQVIDDYYPDYGYAGDVFGTGYGNYYRYEVGEEKGSYFIFPYLKLGFEGEVFSWMDIRAGGYTTLWSNSEKWESDFDVDETWNTASQETYFGFGFNWGKLYLDTYTDPELLLKGFDFISGSGYDEGYYQMNWQVSMVYELF